MQEDFYADLGGMELSVDQITELKQLHRGTRDKRGADRIKAVLLLGEGFSHVQVGKILLMDDDTVRGHGKRYLSDGIPGLLRDGRGGKKAFLDKSQMALLDMHLQEKVYMGIGGVIQWIKDTFCVSYSRSGATDLLHRMGYTYKKPKKMPRIADVHVQENFVEGYKALCKALGPHDRILFMDGTHPMHNTVAAHGWVKKNVSAQLPSNTGRRRININGTLDLKGRKVTVMECERIDSQAVIEHLGILLNTYEKGRIYIVLDNARYYRSKVVKAFLEEHPRIAFFFLPPYCPNLNIIERLWLVMKREAVFNRYYEKFDSFREAILGFFQNRLWDKPKYRKFLTDKFHILKTDFSGFKTA